MASAASPPRSGATPASIPTTSNGIEFDFINATNGAYPDSEVYWDVNGVEESIAQSPYYSMASCNSCRVYFYLGSPSSSYNDFIELNSSGTTINADTSRVDAFGLPLAIHLHNSNGTDTVVGENDRSSRRAGPPCSRSSRTTCPRPSSNSPP